MRGITTIAPHPPNSLFILVQVQPAPGATYSMNCCMEGIDPCEWAHKLLPLGDVAAADVGYYTIVGDPFSLSRGVVAIKLDSEGNGHL